MCNLVLSKTLETGKAATIGKIAHIVGEKSGSARFEDELAMPLRNLPDNLMLLCGTHHDTVDNYDSEYSVAQLRKIKEDFLSKISTVFREELLGVDFAELQVTISYLIQGSPSQTEGSLELITPVEKIQKNELSPAVENFLRMGLVQERQLEDYLNKNVDTTFSSRLRNIIIGKYNELKEGGLQSDEIFYELLDFSSAYSSEFSQKAAGLTIVAYYFNVCDIFEK